MVQPQKIQVVEETAERLSRSRSVLFVQYQGMTVAEMQDLRSRLRETGSEMKVLKNRLVKRAMEDAGVEDVSDLLNGPNAFVFAYEDATSGPRVCTKYAKDNKKLQVMGGLLDKERLDAAKIEALAKMPSREELLTQMAGTLLAPMRQMAVAMHQATAKVVYAMKNRAEQLEDAS